MLHTKINTAYGDTAWAAQAFKKISRRDPVTFPPAEGSVVGDADGDMWLYRDGLFHIAIGDSWSARGSSWDAVNVMGPLHLVWGPS